MGLSIGNGPVGGVEFFWNQVTLKRSLSIEVYSSYTLSIKTETHNGQYLIETHAEGDAGRPRVVDYRPDSIIVPKAEKFEFLVYSRHETRRKTLNKLLEGLQ